MAQATESHTTRRDVLRRAAAIVPAAAVSSLLAGPVLQAYAGVSHQELLESYNEWLFMERRLLCIEMYGDAQRAECWVPSTRAHWFHVPTDGRDWRSLPQPSTRAGLILSAAGVDLRSES